MGRKRILIIVACLVAANGGIAWFVYQQSRTNSTPYIRQWFNDRETRPRLMTTQTCDDVPFILPSTGFIGLLWGDPAGPYNVLRRHTGIDIFGDGPPGTVPIYAAYDGYLTRLEDWLSTVIIRHDDPLQPGRTIWTYYTHMANRTGTESFIVPDFPAGTREVFIPQGALLGYQGDYGGSGVPVGLHLHFSIVLSEPDGSFKNEAVLRNTLDPSPYLGLNVNIADLPERPITC